MFSEDELKEVHKLLNNFSSHFLISDFKAKILNFSARDAMNIDLIKIVMISCLESANHDPG